MRQNVGKLNWWKEAQPAWENINLAFIETVHQW